MTEQTTTVQLNVRTSESKDHLDVWVTLTTPTSGWAVVEAERMRENYSWGFETESKIFLEHTDSSRKIQVGVQRERKTDRNGRWEASFLPNLNTLPSDVKVTIHELEGADEEE